MVLLLLPNFWLIAFAIEIPLSCFYAIYMAIDPKAYLESTGVETTDAVYRALSPMIMENSLVMVCYLGFLYGCFLFLGSSLFRYKNKEYKIAWLVLFGCYQIALLLGDIGIVFWTLWYYAQGVKQTELVFWGKILMATFWGLLRSVYLLSLKKYENIKVE